jgi:hypothetical protein
MTTTSSKHPLIPTKSQTHGWDRWEPAQFKGPDEVSIRATVPGSRVAFGVKVGLGGTVRVRFLKSKTFGMGSVLCWISLHDRVMIKDEGRGREKGVRWDGWNAQNK